MNGLFTLTCPRCGGDLMANGDVYVCQSCNKAFEKQKSESVSLELRKVLDEQKNESVANLRRQLWEQMRAEFIHSEKIVTLAREIKKYLPEDYFACFCEVANGENSKAVNGFLNASRAEDIADFGDIITEFMLKSARAENLTALSHFIERAFKNDNAQYERYATEFETVAKKVNSGLFELSLTRDVFLAYSSADIAKVLELCDFLESAGLTCFLALRNLRHGKGAVDNYEKALKTAMDNCKTVVFVSSTHSRSLACDAFTKELPYIKQRDLECAPAEFKRDYSKLPHEYMLPRVEYLVEGYDGSAIEFMVKEFFHGLEWCKSKEAVLQRLIGYITAPIAKNDDKAERERLENERKVKELEQKLKDAENKLKDAERKKTLPKVSEIVTESKNVTTPPEAEPVVEVVVEEPIKRVGDFVMRGSVLEKYEGSGSFVTVPSGVTEIKGDVFKRCKNILSVSLPQSLTKIGNFAFYGCEKLTSITIPKNVTEIGYQAFNACEALKSVTILGSVEKLDNAFGSCYELSEVKLAEGLKAIERSTFYLCSKLKKINLPKSLKAIGVNAFGGCEALTEVKLGKNLESIGERAFCGCKSLAEIYLPKSVKTVGASVFAGCEKLKNISCEAIKKPDGWNEGYLGGYRDILGTEYAPCKARVNWQSSPQTGGSEDGVKEVKKRAAPKKDAPEFEIKNGELIKYNGKAEKVIVPDGVTEIGNGAFKNCKTAKEIILPDGVTFIGDNAFDGCKLNRIYLPESMGEAVLSSFAFGNAIIGYIDCGIKKPLFGFGWKPKHWTESVLVAYKFYWGIKK